MGTRTPSADGSVSIADLHAFAAEEDAAAARRYGDLAHRARATGPGELAKLFTDLAGREVGRNPAVGSGRAGDAVRVRRLLPGALKTGETHAEAMRSTLLTPYRVLSLAVDEEMRAFTRYVHVAALADVTEVRMLAEELARTELAQAATLRRARRQAWRAERPQEAPPPATLADLRVLGENWESGTQADAPGYVVRLSQAVERYLWVAERATDEAVLAEAQRRAQSVLRRLLTAQTAESTHDPSAG